MNSEGDLNLDVSLRLRAGRKGEIIVLRARVSGLRINGGGDIISGDHAGQFLRDAHLRAGVPHGLISAEGGGTTFYFPPRWRLGLIDITLLIGIHPPVSTGAGVTFRK